MTTIHLLASLGPGQQFPVPIEAGLLESHQKCSAAVLEDYEAVTIHLRLEVPVRRLKANAQRGKLFRERKKKEKLEASPVEKVTKNPQKNSTNSSSATAKSPS
ncbi:hypothetical protein TNCV_4477571 [Trichonephila clavipes]|nr:hypothetical protein TNCV_4477571 [Trichonephila clavipes]